MRLETTVFEEGEFNLTRRGDTGLGNARSNSEGVCLVTMEEDASDFKIGVDMDEGETWSGENEEPKEEIVI